MLPGTVTSDAQAFEQVLERLESEVGTILRLIPAAKEGVQQRLARARLFETRV